MSSLTQLARLRATERWIAKVRLFAVAFAVVEVGLLSNDYPPGYERGAWVVTAVFALGALAIHLLARTESERGLRALALAAVVFDTLVISAYAFVFSYEYGNQTRFALIFAVAEACLRFGLRGGIVLPLLSAIPLAAVEWWRVYRFGDEPGAPGFIADRIVFPVGVLLLLGLILGRLVGRLEREADVREERAIEAEASRDELGHRADVLDGVTRCARAIGSSLDLDEAFGAFIRELRGVAPFDRVAIVLSDGDEGSVMAAAGAESESIYPAGSPVRVSGSIMAEVLASGRATYRPDIAEPLYPEERRLLVAGVRSRVVAPLLAGTNAIGILALSRGNPNAFRQREVELVELLGRVVGSAVQNMRAFDAERERGEELQRLSSLRADFVSLVSHELRSPMAAVIGSARTLQSRWRELSPDHRESFLALIADETTRLAALIGDVLDTSRIDAGTFSISFGAVDLAELARDCAAAASISQDEVAVVARARGTVPTVRGDGERLRQVLVNLIDNAVKYSPHGETVEVETSARNGSAFVAVSDRGPGISSEDQGLVFEKFGRVTHGESKPGTGLGLYIARSIVEAHGGTLSLRATPGGGATFELALPV